MDRIYMQRAIELAKKGYGYVNPNPAVGAVIVKDGRIIAEGYHERYGTLHAERNAFANLKESAEGATIYVTLEPCCHHGKQPPCTDAIIEHKIAKVVIGSRDPNPLVHGKGCQILKEHGIEVIEDFMIDECDELNPAFFQFIQTGRPYVVMKYAMTLDGKIATHTGQSQWITGEKARAHVHVQRSRYAAIMAGIGTVLADNPMLNARIPGETPHQPVRIIIDSKLSIPMECNLVKTANEIRTVVAYGTEPADNKKELLSSKGIELIHCPDNEGHVDIKKVIDWMAEQRLDSVLIEGGGQIHEAALKAGVVNHVMAYIGPKLFGGRDAKTPVEGMGIADINDCAKLEFKKMTQLGEDILLEYDVKEEMMNVHGNS